MTVILQAAISGESGRNGPRSTVIQNIAMALCAIHRRDRSQCLVSMFVGKKILLSDCNILVRECRIWHSCYDTFHYRHTASYCPKCVLMFCCVCTDL